MTTEFLGENAVRELFDIIAENYVSREELETREESMASATSVGAALIAAALLKVAEAINNVKGGEGGDSEKNVHFTAEDIEEIFSNSENSLVGFTQEDVEEIFGNDENSLIGFTQEDVDYILKIERKFFK